MLSQELSFLCYSRAERLRLLGSVMLQIDEIVLLATVFAALINPNKKNKAISLRELVSYDR